MKHLKLFENFNSVSSVKELSDKLKEYSIPINQYGVGQSKTIQHLFNELQEWECRIEDENGILVRYIDFVGVKVFYKDLFLKEDRQEFKDGRVRRRDIKASVAEKMKPNEDPMESVIRGMEEELKIKVDPSQIKSTKPLSYSQSSKSYPGLETKYNEYPFICHLNDKQFKSDGYIEVQKDKSTFFKWIKM